MPVRGTIGVSAARLTRGSFAHPCHALTEDGPRRQPARPAGVVAEGGSLEIARPTPSSRADEDDWRRGPPREEEDRRAPGGGAKEPWRPRGKGETRDEGGRVLRVRCFQAKGDAREMSQLQAPFVGQPALVLAGKGGGGGGGGRDDDWRRPQQTREPEGAWRSQRVPGP